MNSRANAKLRTGEALIHMGAIDQVQLDQCLVAQRLLAMQSRRVPLGDIVLRYGFASRAQVDEAVKITSGGESGISDVQLPASVLQDARVMPLGVDGKIASVASLKALDDTDILSLIDAYRDEGIVIDQIKVVPRGREEILDYLKGLSHVDPLAVAKQVADFNRNHTDGSMLHDLVQNIVYEALQMRASDIHIYRSLDPLFNQISFRIDNDLRPQHLLTVEAMAAFATSIKIKGDMDASDIKRPQDSRMRVEFHTRQIDMRIATVPTADGEKITIRLLDQSKIQTIDTIMFDHPVVAKWASSISDVRGKEGGIVLVTGPTGSGKSTTLTAMLRSMPRHKINVVTAEDPVEIRVPLVLQTQTTEELTYAKLARSFMRQDPDVMVIGEIRDSETAGESIKVAETGHLVLSTLHTNTAIDSIKRMSLLMPEDQKVAGTSTLASLLKLVMNQRLVRRLCSCATVVDPSLRSHGLYAAVCDHLDITGDKIRQKKGCSRCKETGYHGRALMLEAVWFPSDPIIRDAMETTLIKNDIAALLSIDGVLHYSRKASARALLAHGAIDIQSAIDVLDIDIEKLAHPSASVTPIALRHA
jgi:type II secretory ATPase GspE/PulE/Tfp pilus assembly ATPase PilB-like protein